jgi:hypothetical protein
MFYLILRWIIIIVAILLIIKSVKFIRVILTVALGIIYIPINNLNLAVQKWYFGIRHKDKILYYLFTPFYWIIVGITFLISIPYEFVIAMDIH